MSKLNQLYSRALYLAGSTHASPPSTIYLVVNSKCNLSCSMCDVGSKRKESQFYKVMDKGCELELELIERLVDECTWKPTFAITSTEPLLYKDILEAAKIIKHHSCKLQLTTNGFLLTFHNAWIVEYVDDLWVSIDGPRDTHNKIRGNRKAWENAVEMGVYSIAAWKAENKKDTPRLHINYTITKDNYNELVPFMGTFNWDWVDDISFSHLNFVTHAMACAHNYKYPELPATKSSATSEDVWLVDPDVLWNQIQYIKQNYKGICSFTPDLKTREELRRFYTNPHLFLKGHDKCYVPWNVAQILADGTLGVSTRCFDVNLGNLHENTFAELWNGDKMREFRKRLRKVRAYPACSRCCGVF